MIATSNYEKLNVQQEFCVQQRNFSSIFSHIHADLSTESNFFLSTESGSEEDE